MRTAEQKAQDVARNRAKRAEARANGMCGACRNRRASDGLATCQECLLAKRESRARVRRGESAPLGRPAKKRPKPRTAEQKRRYAEQVKRRRIARPEIGAAKAKRVKERYWARKLSGCCVECGAGLLENAAAVRCGECNERQRERQNRYARGEAYRKYQADWHRHRYQTDPAFRERQRIKRMETRAELKRIGLSERQLYKAKQEARAA